MENDINNNNDQTYINLKNNRSELRKALDYFKFLGNCPRTPSSKPASTFTSCLRQINVSLGEG